MPVIASSVSSRDASSDWPEGADDVRTLAGMQDQRIAIGANNRREKRID